MQRALTAGRLGVIVAIAAVVGAVWSAGALAGTKPYTVHVKLVPSGFAKPLKLGKRYNVNVYGNSANTSRLKAFRNANACSPTEKQNASQPGNVLYINKKVTGKYAETNTFKAKHFGTHFICAYLLALPPAPPGHRLRARAGARYRVA